MYILDSQHQNRLIREMSLTQKDTSISEAYYYHPGSEEMWKSFFPMANGDKLGPKILRFERVPESLEEWLKQCLIDGTVEDARGLGIELSATPNRWQQLMELVEANYRQYTRKNLKSFLKSLQIENYQPLFNQLDLKIENLDLEKETLEKLAKRSKKIRFKRFWFF